MVLFSWRWWNNENIQCLRSVYGYCRGKKRLNVSFVLDEYNICERTLRYYQAVINELIIPRRNLQCFISDELIYVDEVKTIK